MHHVSSNLTLLVKFFIPTFWAVFFGAFMVSVLVSENAYYGNIPAFLFKVGVAGFYLLGLLIIWRFFFRLKRVEMDADFVYATNYFKAFRYPWKDVEQVDQWGLGITQYARVKLKASGSFGSSISFLMSKKRMSAFLDEHPGKARHFIKEEED